METSPSLSLLEIRKTLKADPQTVFDALTQTDQLNQWFYAMEEGSAKVTLDISNGSSSPSLLEAPKTKVLAGLLVVRTQQVEAAHAIGRELEYGKGIVVCWCRHSSIRWSHRCPGFRPSVAPLIAKRSSCFLFTPLLCVAAALLTDGCCHFWKSLKHWCLLIDWSGEVPGDGQE